MGGSTPGARDLDQRPREPVARRLSFIAPKPAEPARGCASVKLSYVSPPASNYQQANLTRATSLLKFLLLFASLSTRRYQRESTTRSRYRGLNFCLVSRRNVTAGLDTSRVSKRLTAFTHTHTHAKILIIVNNNCDLPEAAGSASWSSRHQL